MNKFIGTTGNFLVINAPKMLQCRSRFSYVRGRRFWKSTNMRSKQHVIAITQRLSFIEAYEEERESLDSQWYDFARDLTNVQLLPISYKSDPGAFLDQFAVDCVILSGGNDIFQPQRAPKNVTESLSAKRDRFELSLIAEAKIRNVRVLGVCRGLQLLLLQYGAHIAPVSRHVGRLHTLVRYLGPHQTTSAQAVERCSWIFDEDGALKGDFVNSFHNYAAQITPNMHPGVEVLAVPTDQDVIEAFVHVADGVAGMMWHPERSHGVARDRDIALVRSLLGLNKLISPPSKTQQERNVDICVVVLCAGQGTRLRPLTDSVPKCMVKYKDRAIIDYALSVYHLHGLEDVTLVTGYKASELKRPRVKYVHNQDYARTNMVNSLFCALATMQDNQKDLIVSYSDIIYTPDVLGKLLSPVFDDADILVVVDKDWLKLWRSRMDDPLSDAETLKVNKDGYIVEIGQKTQRYDDIEGQYIGLLKFTPAGVGVLTKFFHSLDVNRMYDGKPIDEMYMTTLLQLMIDSGIKVRPVFIKGGWTEIDCQEDLKVDIDVSMIPLTFRGQTIDFGTKADTLESLQHLNICRILPLVHFTKMQWQLPESRTLLLTRCKAMLSPTDLLIVRSSAANEDSLKSSAAGLHETVSNVPPDAEHINEAVQKVFASYRVSDELDQVLIQPMLQNVVACGVICTTELQDYMPYFVLSYEEGGGTDAVTSGSKGDIKTIYIAKLENYPMRLAGWQQQVLEIAGRLEDNFQNDKLDIEFAVKDDMTVYILQVRPVVVPNGMPKMLPVDFVRVHKEVQADTESKLVHHEVLDNMMDWNPAEMIGVVPSPLARSLYEVLITDTIAMRSRATLGYRDVSNEALMCTIGGRPYIRASVSFESFIPASLDATIAKKLVQHYLSMLREQPDKHDKVEFEIVFSCFEPDLSERLERLGGFGFTQAERDDFQRSLLELTNNIFRRVEDDLATVALLPLKVSTIQLQKMKDPVAQLVQTLEAVKTFGTLPFANLARSAFVAISLLKSLQRTGHLEENAYNQFLESLHTVSKELGRDLVLLQQSKLTKETFLLRYGHLRPGTYDICTPRYDENFELYFGNIATEKRTSLPPICQFQLNDEVTARITSHLQQCGLKIDCGQLFEFCRKSIEGREKAKFIFTEAVSNILVKLTELGESLNIHRFDMSFLDLKSILRHHKSCNREIIWENIVCSRNHLRSVSKLKLPPTICSTRDLWLHEEITTRPNFVTKKSVTGDVVTESTLFRSVLNEKIVVVESADPGWDWLFSNTIQGLITCYGGANSHMAIRAAELSLPAAIGVGKSKFDLYIKAQRLKIDACAQTIVVLQ